MIYQTIMPNMHLETCFYWVLRGFGGLLIVHIEVMCEYVTNEHALSQLRAHNLDSTNVFSKATRHLSQLMYDHIQANIHIE